MITVITFFLRSKHWFMTSGRITNYMINIHTLLTGKTTGCTDTWITPMVQVNILDLKWGLVEESNTQSSLVWRKTERGGGGEERPFMTAQLVPVHVCVSNYHWNLLQAPARAATERWLACRIKARVVGKGVVERNTERERVCVGEICFRKGRERWSKSADRTDKELL